MYCADHWWAIRDSDFRPSSYTIGDSMDRLLVKLSEESAETKLKISTSSLRMNLETRAKPRHGCEFYMLNEAYWIPGVVLSNAT